MSARSLAGVGLVCASGAAIASTASFSTGALLGGLAGLVAAIACIAVGHRASRRPDHAEHLDRYLSSPPPAPLIFVVEPDGTGHWRSPANEPEQVARMVG